MNLIRPLLLINPNTSLPSTVLMLHSARAALPPCYAVLTATATRGAAMITNEAELAIAEEEVLVMGKARATFVSAIVISAFGNPGLQALRQRVAVPVVGIGEAAMLEAGAGGRRFGIVTTTPALQGAIERVAQQLGLGPQLTCIRFTPGDPLVLAGDPRQQEERLAEAVQACIELGGAQAVIVGGGPLARAADSLSQRFELPVISPVAAAMRLVLARLGPTSEAAQNQQA
ncbi:MAG: aspartate/glutamate racemase family protein [Polaromonas sp.]